MDMVSMQQPSVASEVWVPHDKLTLSIMWALEDCDDIMFSGDFLDLPDMDSAFIPAISELPSFGQTFKRKSLSSLRREKALSTARLEDKTSVTVHVSNKVDADRKRFRTVSSFQCARICSKNAHTELTLPLMLEVQVVEGLQLAKMHCMKSNKISASFLAGAAALGLRRRRSRAISEPPVKQCACFNASTSKKKHVTNNDLKEKVFADERSAIAIPEQKLKEAMLVPHAPRRPQPESHRKRPQIRGVPIVVIPKN